MSVQELNVRHGFADVGRPCVRTERVACKRRSIRVRMPVSMARVGWISQKPMNHDSKLDVFRKRERVVVSGENQLRH